MIKTPIIIGSTLRRTFHPERTRLMPVVLGLAVAALAPVFFLTGDTLPVFLLVPSALLAWMTLHAVATSASRANAAMWSSQGGLVRRGRH